MRTRDVVPAFVALLAAGACLSAASVPPGASAAGPAAGGLSAEDAAGRPLGARPLVLVDWDGPLSNPAVPVSLRPPAGAAFPAKATLSCPEPRVYFDLPSETAAGGARKTVELKAASDRATVLVSIFPDRDGQDERSSIRIECVDAAGAKSALEIPLRVLDQDAGVPAAFPLLADFSQDRTGFFSDEKNRAVVRRALDDWAFFLEPIDLDPVPAGAEETHIWNPEGFKSGRVVKNEKEYSGFLVYVYGMKGPELRSGGEASREGGFQTNRKAKTGLRRSGGLEIETQGNFNRLGWFLTKDDADWWTSGNLGSEQNDLYSIAHHELGHTLFFNFNYPGFMRHKSRGTLKDEALKAYHGSYPKVDKSDHFPGAVDRASRRGAFGYEYHGDVPRRRWTITKFDLMAAAAVSGYRIRRTFDLKAGDAALPPASAGKPYEGAVRWKGGVPPFSCVLASGALPEGLALDPGTGDLSGVPARAGVFPLALRVTDADGASVSFPVRIEVR